MQSTIDLNLIILIINQCFEIAHDKAIRFEIFILFVCFLSFPIGIFFYKFEPFGFIIRFHSYLFQIITPKCHKFYPNCIWHVPSEWYNLKFHSALLTKVYWKYATNIVRVCVFLYLLQLQKKKSSGIYKFIPGLKL